jgi:hypothetical protein
MDVVVIVDNFISDPFHELGDLSILKLDEGSRIVEWHFSAELTDENELDAIRQVAPVDMQFVALIISAMKHRMFKYQLTERRTLGWPSSSSPIRGSKLPGSLSASNVMGGSIILRSLKTRAGLSGSEMIVISGAVS